MRQTSLWLWHALCGNRRQAALNAVVGLASVGSSLAQVWAVQRAIDIASGAAAGSLVAAVGIMAALIAVDFGIGMSRVWIRNILGIRAQNLMQRQALAKLMETEWRGREAMHSGDVTNRLEGDVATVVTFLTETLPGALSVVAMFAGAFAYLLMMDATLALVTVGILPAFVLLSRFYVSRMRKYTRRVRQGDSRVQALLQETVQHRMIVKTLECHSQMLASLDRCQSRLRGHVRRRTLFSVLSGLVLNLGFSVGYLVAFLWSALRLQQGFITFGGMTAFLQLVYRIQSPARDLTKLAPAFVAVFTAAERLMELEALPRETTLPHVRIAGPCGVRLAGVSYRYGGCEREVVSGLTFDFPPRSVTAVLGETGAGKTTLVRLMLALVRPTAGRIELYAEGGPAIGLTPAARCNFVYVPQGNTLVSGTIRDNLLMGRADATEAELRGALETACAEFVYGLPGGLDATTAEQGGGLSEGQAQRIAIARALLRDGGVMLLDEPTSALDPDTERRLLANLLKGNSKTMIFVTHRPEVLKYCTATLRIKN